MYVAGNLQSTSSSSHTIERELQRLQHEVLVLGSMVENALIKSVDMLKRRDLKGNPRTVAQARFLSRVACNLERAASRVNGICEWVVFLSWGDFGRR